MVNKVKEAVMETWEAQVIKWKGVYILAIQKNSSPF